MVEFLIRARIAVRKIVNRCPQRLRRLGGPLLGGIIGLIGGIPGFFIGLLLGYLLRELFYQSFRDRRILTYFENPGQRQFYEAEPGLAAWCALAVLVSSEDNPESSQATPAESILKQVMLEASCVFAGPLSDPFLIEHFSRLALSVREKLNKDLLAESLASRRASLRLKGQAGIFDSGDDLRNLGQALSRLAGGEKARRLAHEICLVFDPSFESEKDNAAGDPWKILGLPPGTQLREVKSHYRRLAKLFHPDELEVLDEQRRETAARAFIAIKDAYQKIIDN